MQQERSAILTRVPLEVREKLERLAERNERSLGAEVAVAVREHCERNAPAAPAAPAEQR